MNGPKVIIAIPAYNCASQIVRVLDELDSRVMDDVYEVLVLDNCSKDDTFEAAKGKVAELRARRGWKNLKVVRNRENLSLGGSHKAAILHARAVGAEYLGIIHGDHQATPKEFPALLEIAKAHPEYAAVLGARFMPGSRLVGYSKARIFGNVALNLAFTALSGRMTFDLGSGLNLFRLQDFSDEAFLKFDDGLTFNIDLVLFYYAKHARLKFFPITWSEHDQVSNAKNFDIGLRALKALVRWRFLNRIDHELPPRAYQFGEVFEPCAG
jgi:glycosyltransferase involved in cell wall biosynthesis